MACSTPKKTYIRGRLCRFCRTNLGVIHGRVIPSVPILKVSGSKELKQIRLSDQLLDLGLMHREPFNTKQCLSDMCSYDCFHRKKLQSFEKISEHPRRRRKCHRHKKRSALSSWSFENPNPVGICANTSFFSKQMALIHNSCSGFRVKPSPNIAVTTDCKEWAILTMASVWWWLWLEPIVCSSSARWLAYHNRISQSER